MTSAEPRPDARSQFPLWGAGAALIALGLTVIAGWRFDVRALAALFPSGPRMAIDAACCFGLIGLALIMRAMGRLALAGAVSLVVAGWALVVTLGFVATASDTGMFADIVGHMRPGTGLGIFVSASLALVLSSEAPSGRLLKIGCGVLIGLTVVAVLCRAVGLEFAGSWDKYRIAPANFYAFGLVTLPALIWVFGRGIDRSVTPILAATTMVLIFTMGFFALRSNRVFVAGQESVRHTFVVRETVWQIVAYVFDCDISRRNFEQTRDDRYFAEFERDADQAGITCTTLLELVNDNPGQYARAWRLRRLVDDKIGSSRRFVENDRRAPMRAAARASAVTETLNLTAEVRAVAATMWSEEKRLLDQRLDHATTAADETNRLIVLGSTVSMLLVLVALALMQKSDRARQHIEDQLRIANTELRGATSRALESTRLKAQFLATMSHEIRTPMNGVIGMIGLLLDTELTPEQRSFATTVRTSSEALLTVLNDILDFSKIEAGQLVFESTPFDVREPVENCVALLAERAQRSGLELMGAIAPDVPARVIGDAGRVHQVLLNLVSNAVKFTSQGEVVVRVVTVAERAGKVRLKFSVRDTGPGIDSETQAKLFQPFVQADGSTARRYGGSGLGLAICRQLSHLMGGESGVESVLGEGSTFWFTAEFPVDATAPARFRSPEDWARRRVLVVDANATHRALLLDELAALHVAGVGAASASEAMAALGDALRARRPYDVAIADAELSGSRGYDLAKTIAAHPEFRGLGVILLAGVGQTVDPADLETARITRVIVKPVRQLALREALAALFGAAQRGTVAPEIAAADRVSSRRASDLRVLVAEDNPVNQQVVRAQLRKLGYEPDVVADGHEAIAAVQAKPFDVVLLDVQMPGLDGIETTRRIRQWESDRAAAGESVTRLRIVALTANAMAADREACLAAGMDGFVTKPVRMTDLAAVLAGAPSQAQA